MTRYRCPDCSWVGSDLIEHADPFNETVILTSCPRCCRTAEFTPVCDEPGCGWFAGIGIPTDTGYRWACYKHDPNRPG